MTRSRLILVLVAALAANEDGSDEAWTSASGTEPFLVESCGFDVIVQRAVERFDADGSGDLDADERASDPDNQVDGFLGAGVPAGASVGASIGVVAGGVVPAGEVLGTVFEVGSESTGAPAASQSR